MSWFHNGSTDICVMGFSYGLMWPTLARCIDVSLTRACEVSFHVFGSLPTSHPRTISQRHELDSMMVMASSFLRQVCLICGFVLYHVNAPWELLSFNFWGRRSVLKSEPCKSNQLYSFADKILVNQNTFSKSHSIMRNLNWKRNHLFIINARVRW